MITAIQMSNLSSIDSKRDVIWSPFHLVDVPVIVQVEVLVRMILQLRVSITIDCVQRDGILLGGNNIDINLIPAARIEAWAIPEGVEGSHGALLVRVLHLSHELPVSESLMRCNSSTLVVSLCNADHCNQTDNELLHFLLDLVLNYYNSIISIYL